MVICGNILHCDSDDQDNEYTPGNQGHENYGPTPEKIWLEDAFSCTFNSNHKNGNFPLFSVLLWIACLCVFCLDPSIDNYAYHPDHGWLTLLTYSFLHANGWHLLWNCIALLYCAYLELFFDSYRPMAIYFLGCIMGGLGHVVFHSDETILLPLVGASGGAFAVCSAQVANCLVNFDSMRKPLRIISLLVLGPVIYYSWQVIDYLFLTTNKSEVSDAAHLGGLIVGWTISLALIRNYQPRKCEQWLTIILAVAFILIFVVFVVIVALY